MRLGRIKTFRRPGAREKKKIWQNGGLAYFRTPRDLTSATFDQHRRVALFTIQNEFRYDIVRKIFEGGMGIVYEAEQQGAREFVKRVAIKVIRQDYASQKQFIENFVGEAKLVADLIHTNIVQTYHLGETRGVYFICHGINPRREPGAIQPPTGR